MSTRTSEAYPGTSLEGLTQCKWMRQRIVHLPAVPCHLRVIKQQLWCCCDGAGIIVLDTDLQQQRTIPAGEMCNVHDVAERENGDVIIAASGGLYKQPDNGQLDKVRIEAGTFTCVELHHGCLYVPKAAVPEVHVYRCEDDAYQIQQVFKVPRQEMKDANAWMNISVQRDRVTYTYSSTGDNKIHIYSLTGERLTSHNKPSTVAASEWNYTYICDGDDDSNVLIADAKADQLYVMTERGEYRAVQLEPAVNHPRGAVMLNGDLFVASGIMRLWKYSCQRC